MRQATLGRSDLASHPSPLVAAPHTRAPDSSPVPDDLTPAATGAGGIGCLLGFLGGIGLSAVIGPAVCGQMPGGGMTWTHQGLTWALAVGGAVVGAELLQGWGLRGWRRLSGRHRWLALLLFPLGLLGGLKTYCWLSTLMGPQ